MRCASRSRDGTLTDAHALLRDGAADAIARVRLQGSAHTVLAVVWAARLGGGRTSFSAFQASKRGGAMGVRIGENGRVFLSGTALTMMDGTLRNIV